MLDCFTTAQEQAERASVAAFVTYHFRPHTMQFLARVLRNLSGFCVSRMHVTVVTNADDRDTQQRIAGLCRNYFPRGDFEVASFPRLDSGNMLTWKHKPLLRTAVKAGHSHFIYVEDDIDFVFDNFLYFLRYFDGLAQCGLVPSFLRTEFNTDAGELRSTDALYPTLIGNAPLVEVGGQAFASPNFPYCASYVLNRSLADEHLASRSFDYERSREVSDWGVSERAAMGVCWENPPEGYAHRYMLPVSSDMVPLPFCQTPHMPSNYTNTDTVFGRVPVNRVFSV